MMNLPKNINRATAPKQFFFDGGNLKIKYADRNTAPRDLTHGLYEITEQQLMDDYLFYRNTPDYIAIDFGDKVRHFILGNTARDKLQGTLRQGAGRYTRDYIGVLAVWSICNMYMNNHPSPVPTAPTEFYGMYPPRDRRQKQQYIDSIKGEWIVSHFCGADDFLVDISKVKAVFEPIGGYHCRVLDENGYVDVGDEAYQTDTIGVDVGSLTTDTFPADAGGKVDVSAATSEKIGLLQVIKNIQSAILGAYAEELGYANTIKHERLEESIRTGVLRVGRDGTLDVGGIVYEEAKPLFAPIDALIYSQGGTMSYQTMLIMGGGGALLYPLFLEKYGNDLLVLPSIELPMMQFANVLGLRKMVKLLGAS